MSDVHRAPLPHARRVVLARALLLVATLPLTLLAGAAVVVHPSAYDWSDSTLYAVPGVGALVALLGFVASFAPFDRPQSTPRWTRPLAGLLVGAAAAGLCVFTPSFLLLGPLLLLLAAALHFGARAVAQGPPDLELPTTSLTPAQLAELADPPLDWRVALPLVLGALLGLSAVVLWRPRAGSVAVLPPDQGVASIVSRSFPPLRAGRLIRHGRSVEVRGHDLRLHVSLDRPRILLRMRDQDLTIEPCLLIEAGSTDGFVPLGPLNSIRLEPGGPGLVDFVEGRNRAWVRVAYPRGRATQGGLSAATGFLGRHAAEGSIAATLELEVDLDWGEVTIDARTRLDRPGVAARASLGWLHLADAPQLPCRVGFDEGFDLVPDEEPLPPRAGRRFFVRDQERTRLIHAKRAGAGPYESERIGEFHDWFVLPSLRSQTLVVAPDWQRLASRAPSRSAGFGLPENSLRFWREEGGLNVLLDVASARHGSGFLPSALPIGLYRNRIVLHPLGREDPAEAAAAILARLELAEQSGAAVDRVASPTSSGEPPPELAPSPFAPR